MRRTRGCTVFAIWAPFALAIAALAGCEEGRYADDEIASACQNVAAALRHRAEAE